MSPHLRACLATHSLFSTAHSHWGPLRSQSKVNTWLFLIWFPFLRLSLHWLVFLQGHRLQQDLVVWLCLKSQQESGEPCKCLGWLLSDSDFWRPMYLSVYPRYIPFSFMYMHTHKHTHTHTDTHAPPTLFFFLFLFHTHMPLLTSKAEQGSPRFPEGGLQPLCLVPIDTITTDQPGEPAASCQKHVPWGRWLRCEF